MKHSSSSAPLDLFTSPRFMAAMLFIGWILIAAAILTRYELRQRAGWNGHKGNGGSEPVACTMDAMICPDGRAIGRTGPNCEFVCE